MSDDVTNGAAFALPGFELIEKAGQGGMAEVWKARQVSLDRVVAIKILHPQLSNNTDEIDRLLTEARAAAKLKHQGIVQVYDAGKSGGHYYIVMEFIAGYSIGEWLRRKNIIEEREALLVAECVATALHYAWATARIIHCDIKPDNIMVDRDGAIKVADLGLAHMVNPRLARPKVEEIIGTPSYISPEQSQGEDSLDCRTDIYALGAMLYHMVTGRRLFEKYPDLEAMDRQITDFEPDPIEFNPNLSAGICWLIEKMLVKDREGRQADWDEVMGDIKAVQEGLLPVTSRPTEGASTVKRSRNRPAPPVVVKKRGPAPETFAPAPSKTNGLGITLAVVAIVIVIIGVVWWLSARAKPPAFKPAVVLPTPALHPQPTPSGGNNDSAREAFDFADKWAKGHPGVFHEAIQRFRKVANETKGTKYSMMAEDEIRRLERELKERTDAVMRTLRQAADKAAEGERFEEAAALMNDYTGVLAQETQELRRGLADDYRRRGEQVAAALSRAAQEIETLVQRVFAEAADAVIAGQLPKAEEILARACADQKLATHKQQLDAAHTVITGAMNINTRILDSFRQQIGQLVTVNLTQGAMKLTVSGVDQRLVRCHQQLETGGSMEFEFKVDDLAPIEKLNRMGSDDQPEVACAKGIMALQAKAYAKAAEFFTKTGGGMAPPLIETSRSAEKEYAEKKAETAAIRLALGIGVKLGPYAGQAWREAIRAANVPMDRRAELARQLKPFEENHGATRIGRSALEIFGTLVNAAPLLEEPQVRPVAAVALNERNPGNPRKIRRDLLAANVGLRNDEIELQADDNGWIVRAAIFSPAIVDLSPLVELGRMTDLAVGENDPMRPLASLKNLAPLARMPQLQRLYVGCSMVDDISPLKGLQLRSLTLRQKRVRDISVVQTMPLEELVIAETDIRSLAPLRGRPLQLLDISNTKISDLQPLTGLPLRTLFAVNTSVQSLIPLRNMPLTRLNLTGCKAFDFTPLRNMPLRWLELADTNFKDFGILKTMPLTRLGLSNLKIGDLSCLKGLMLEELNLQGAVFKNLEPLHDMPLKRLVLADTRVSSLDPLVGMPLTYLVLANTQVSDLSPLKDVPLKELDITGTSVHNLEPIETMSLTSLRFDGDKIRDFEPLRNTQIETLWINGNNLEQHLRRIVHKMPRLRSINGSPVGAWGQQRR